MKASCFRGLYWHVNFEGNETQYALVENSKNIIRCPLSVTPDLFFSLRTEVKFSDGEILLPKLKS
jgi:hypothetical protein